VESDLPAADISRRLKAALEPYARPRVMRVVTAMPVTRTGKYDREAIGHLF
jgi:acyl-coenzyme A synthetase/AMP-(fatty) acid ligase